MEAYRDPTRAPEGSQGQFNATSGLLCSGALFCSLPHQAAPGPKMAYADRTRLQEASERHIQRPKKWLVRGLVKFVTAVARLVCLNLLG